MDPDPFIVDKQSLFGRGETIFGKKQAESQRHVSSQLHCEVQAGLSCGPHVEFKNVKGNRWD